MPWITTGSTPKRQAAVVSPKPSMEFPTSLSVRGVPSAPAIIEQLTAGECRLRSVVFLDLRSVVEFDFGAPDRPRIFVRGQVSSRVPSGPYFAYTISLAPMTARENDELVAAQRRLDEPRPAPRARPALFAVAPAATEAMPANGRPSVQFPIFYRTAFEGPRPGRAASVSATGMTMTCNDALVEGMALELTFTLPSVVLEAYGERQGPATLRRPFRQMVLQARVICHQPLNGGACNYGLEFRNLPLESREEIARYERALQLAKR